MSTPALHAAGRVVDASSISATAGEVAPRAARDVMLCRNVFIYFSPAAVSEVGARSPTAMPTPGYLCVGASESLLRVTRRFELEEIGGAFVYVKRDEAQLRSLDE